MNVVVTAYWLYLTDELTEVVEDTVEIFDEVEDKEDFEIENDVGEVMLESELDLVLVDLVLLDLILLVLELLVVGRVEKI